MISIFSRVTKFGLLLTALVLVAALRLAFMVRWTLDDTLAFLLLLSLLLPSLLIMFIPSTLKRPVSSWKALNLRKTFLMASSVRLKPLNCSRLPCVYAEDRLTFLLTQKKTCVRSLGSSAAVARYERQAERRSSVVCRWSTIVSAEASATYLTIPYV